MRFFGYPYDGSEEGLRALADSVLIVGFRPRQEVDVRDPGLRDAVTS